MVERPWPPVLFWPVPFAGPARAIARPRALTGVTWPPAVPRFPGPPLRPPQSAATGRAEPDGGDVIRADFGGPGHGTGPPSRRRTGRAGTTPARPARRSAGRRRRAARRRAAATAASARRRHAAPGSQAGAGAKPRALPAPAGQRHRRGRPGSRPVPDAPTGWTPSRPRPSPAGMLALGRRDDCHHHHAGPHGQDLPRKTRRNRGAGGGHLGQAGEADGPQTRRSPAGRTRTT